jgi:hypothetical protein
MKGIDESCGSRLGRNGAKGVGRQILSFCSFEEEEEWADTREPLFAAFSYSPFTPIGHLYSFAFSLEQRFPSPRSS